MICYLYPFLCPKQLISWKLVKHFTYRLLNKSVPEQNKFPVPITQDMDFYFNIVTVINFLTSVINAIIISICYKKCKDLTGRYSDCHHGHTATEPAGSGSKIQ